MSKGNEIVLSYDKWHQNWMKFLDNAAIGQWETTGPFSRQL